MGMGEKAENSLPVRMQRETGNYKVQLSSCYFLTTAQGKTVGPEEVDLS